MFFPACRPTRRQRSIWRSELHGLECETERLKRTPQNTLNKNFVPLGGGGEGWTGGGTTEVRGVWVRSCVRGGAAGGGAERETDFGAMRGSSPPTVAK